MLFRNIIKLFKNGNVCVTGLRGTGKDMLIANVVCRRNQLYISNVNYNDKLHIEFVPNQFDCGKNSFDNFITGKLHKYVFPFPDGVDIYISDVGVYYPSQYCNELNKKYPYVPIFVALSRQLGDCNVHFNVQNLNRAWDKLREQSDIYISCKWCHVLFGKLVIQRVIIYDLYDSCVRRVKPFSVRLPLLASRELRMSYELERDRYEQNYGKVQSGLLIYFNRSNYDTRVFKSMLEKGVVL